MDKDRIEGAAKQTKGAVKEAVGKVVGDAKLQAEGKARPGGRQAAERGRRAEGRDPQGLRESRRSRDAAHLARGGVTCSGFEESPRREA